jgi:hypothetical protein
MRIIGRELVLPPNERSVIVARYISMRRKSVESSLYIHIVDVGDLYVEYEVLRLRRKTRPIMAGWNRKSEPFRPKIRKLDHFHLKIEGVFGLK